MKLRIGEILLREGLIDEEILSAALRIQSLESQVNPRKLGEILCDEFSVDQEAINQIMARYYGFQELDLEKDPVTRARSQEVKQLVNSLPQNVRKQFLDQLLIPFYCSTDINQTTYFLSPQPTDPIVPNAIQMMGCRRYELLYCPAWQIQQLVRDLDLVTNTYLENFQRTKSDVLEIGESAEDEFEEEDLNAEINQSVLINLVEASLVEGVRMGASDMHIVPKGNLRTEIYFRIDGELRLWYAQERVRSESIAAVLKDRARGVDRFNWDAAQDGFIQRQIDGHLIRYRVSILPIVSTEFRRRFESIVIRILDDRKVIADLNKLGFLEKVQQDFQDAIARPQGLVILSGPTGSGKSTTLYAALMKVISPRVNVLTIEDPVEYHVAGARQIRLNKRLQFEDAIRYILRHDPDVIMVGEMRDRESAETAIKLANTGHLTFSTLHTNDSVSVISRLFKMGIEPFLIAYSINLVVAQRLIRRLCPKCKQPTHQVDPRILKKLGFSEQEAAECTFFEPVGCDECHHGYRGRMGIHEALTFTPEIRDGILSASEEINETQIRKLALANGMYTLRATGRERIKQGETSIAEIAAVTAEE